MRFINPVSTKPIHWGDIERHSFKCPDFREHYDFSTFEVWYAHPEKGQHITAVSMFTNAYSIATQLAHKSSVSDDTWRQLVKEVNTMLILFHQTLQSKYHDYISHIIMDMYEGGLPEYKETERFLRETSGKASHLIVICENDLMEEALKLKELIDEIWLVEPPKSFPNELLVYSSNEHVTKVTRYEES